MVDLVSSPLPFIPSDDPFWNKFEKERLGPALDSFISLFGLNTFLNLTAQMLTDKYLGQSSGVVLRHTKCVFD